MLFLLPPSEGKKIGGDLLPMQRVFAHVLPKEIAVGATEKDLKCTGSRYQQGIAFNNEVSKEPLTMQAIERYTGGMFDAIDYHALSQYGQQFFDKHVCILSGMYGIVHPKDRIANYKLPVSSKGLYAFWGNSITEYINTLENTLIIDVLPLAHKKLVAFSDLTAKVVQVDFFHAGKKMTHGVKGVKGTWIKTICEDMLTDFDQFPTSLSYKGKIIDVVATLIS